MALDDAGDITVATSAPKASVWRHPWRALLIAIGARLCRGHLVVDTPDRERLEFAKTAEPSAFLALHRWRALRLVLIGGDVGFAEAYMNGDWSSPDPAALVELALRNEAGLTAATSGWRVFRLCTRLRHRRHRNTRHGSRRNIARHYDLGNAFYAAWLDRGMTYSGALFATGDETLEAAQTAKYQRVIDLMDLDGPARVLEIGCGWGGLAEALIRRSFCRVTALTLSRQQLDYAARRLGAVGLLDRADLRLEDYRDVRGRFDRIVSIEMLEAVGEEHWPLFFDVLRERLVAGGLAVLQVITISDARFAAYRRCPDFIQRHVFPGGMLPSPAAMRREIARAGLVLASVESFGRSYERTLAEWRRRFQAASAELSALGFAPRFKRMWEYYLAYCEAGFRVGAIDVGLYRIAKPG